MGARALGECLGTLRDTAYRMAYKKQNWVGECATTRVEAAGTSAAADTATVGSVFLLDFSTALQRVLCTVANRSLTLRAILSLPPHSEFAVLEGPSGP